jgi:hypothetical protein
LSLNLGNLRNAVRGLWEELVERRLWPVAIALVVAIVAVPVVMSKSAPQAPAPTPATPAVGGASPLGAFQPAVSTEGRKSSQIRKNLRRFGTKNPFTPKGATFTGSSATGTASVTSGATGAGGVATVSGGQATSTGGTDTGSSTGATGSPATTSPKSGSTGGGTGVTYYTYTVDVRFGKTDNTQTMTLTKFRALPSSNDPIVVFMGVRNDGETAVFLVSADATTTGDGTCSPSDDACTFLYLKKGEKRMIESVGQDGAVVDYELKLRDVNVKKTKGPEKAASSKASSSVNKARRLNFKRALRSFDTLGF